MNVHHRRPRSAAKAAALAATVIATVVATANPGVAAGGRPNPLTGAAAQQAAQHARDSHPSATKRAATASPTDSSTDGRSVDGDALEVADRAEQYANERSAPAQDVSAAALVAARRAAEGMPWSDAHASEVTRLPYQAEPAGYTDPYWSNIGSGFGIVSGRVTALATDGETYYAGAADGGVWRSKDAGRSWASVWDNQDSLSIGALTVGPSHALWVGTGEANTNSDSYRGIGVFRSTNGGHSFARVGGTELMSHQIYRLRDDGNGWMYAATSRGLYRHSDTTGSGAWQLVLKPDPNPTGSPYLTSMITDVVVRPGTHGNTVLAVLGWRNGSSYNGFYESTTGGASGTWSEITPSGDIDASDIGRTTLAYAADGSRLYSIIESPKLLLAGEATNLQGVFVSANGDPTGPWTKIADSAKLGASGSALENLPGYNVGVQSWYNQALAVDPRDPMHVYVSLEEVFQTNDGGSTFTTASPYWNYGLACGDTCPQTTHPDQHALALGDGRVVIGNDGGVYRRQMSVVGYGHWTNLNSDLRTLQYYDAKNGAWGPATAGQGRSSNLAYWGGLQDNGSSLLKPNSNYMVEPAGGDGGNVLVDPADAKRAVGEYTDLAMYRTSDGGHSFTTMSPECGWGYTGSDCDPSARFIAPFVADSKDINHWVAGGSKIWDSTKGWDTSCSGATCDWVAVHDLGLDANGSHNVATALATNGATTYAAWVGGGGNPGPAFASGIDTNYGGSWHRIQAPSLPNRYIAGMTVDTANPAHVYAVFNGYSRRWIDGGGNGVIFESTDGGSTWSNITGNLPDAPGDAVAMSNGKLVLATDVGVFLSDARHPGRWTHLRGLPNTSVNNVSPSADGHGVVAATHGRGIWKITVH